jgi:hypothetical protein
MKPNTFLNKNSIVFEFVSLNETDDIIIKRKTLLQILSNKKEKKTNFNSIFL